MQFKLFSTLFIFCCLAQQAVADDKELAKLVEKAEKQSNLIAEGSPPFHAKLRAADKKYLHPEFNAEIELWWGAPDKWRREIKSAQFSQTAVRNGERYSESNSGDYLPSWLHELATVPFDPLPAAELIGVNAEIRPSGDTNQRCASLKTEFTNGKEKTTLGNLLCFNEDGTVALFSSPVAAAEFRDYLEFLGKLVPRSITIWPKGSTELKAEVTVLERLGENGSALAVDSDTGFASRLRWVSVPEIELHTIMAPPLHWPVIHNFPDKGAVTVQVKLDTSGAVREVGSVICPNAALTDTAAELAKGWKFAPYLVDGVPVQVATSITFPFAAKVVALGPAGATQPMAPAFEHFNKARQLNDPRTEGSAAFHLHATFQLVDGQQGDYTEIWQTPQMWKREVKSGRVTVVKARDTDKIYSKILGSDYTPKTIDLFLDDLDLPLPKTDDTFHEADWGQSAVDLSGVNLLRIARGQVNAQNIPITGQAYWFDSAGVLRAAYWQPRTILYSDFRTWKSKSIPYHVEAYENGAKVSSIQLDSLTELTENSELQFAIDGVKPTIMVDPDDYAGPVFVKPHPIHQVKPDDLHAGHGTVIVDVQLDFHGHVRAAQVRKSAAVELDAAALKAALQWEFTPTYLKGRAVPGSTVLEFQF